MSKKNSKKASKVSKAVSNDADRVPPTQVMKKSGKAPAKGKGKPEVNPTVEIITGQPLPKSKATTKEVKPARSSGLNAAAQVLKDAGQPMRCLDMVTKMLDGGLWKTEGKTPAATIYPAILREIMTKKDKSRFKKTDRGLFTLA
jgi:hypothetical protein